MSDIFEVPAWQLKSGDITEYGRVLYVELLRVYAEIRRVSPNAWFNFIVAISPTAEAPYRTYKYISVPSADDMLVVIRGE